MHRIHSLPPWSIFASQLFQFADCDTTCIESILCDVELLLLRPHQCLTAAEESIVISDGSSVTVQMRDYAYSKLL